jgi:hypothetical protein
MSHVTIHFLANAENLEQAKRHVRNCLEIENSFFDGYEVIDGQCGSLKAKKHILDKVVSEHDYLVKAEKFVAEAEQQRKKKCYGSAGQYYLRAGLLYEQNITDDMQYFNITDWNYDIPPDTKGWFLIPVDFHY